MDFTAEIKLILTTLLLPWVYVSPPQIQDIYTVSSTGPQETSFSSLLWTETRRLWADHSDSLGAKTGYFHAAGGNTAEMTLR